MKTELEQRLHVVESLGYELCTTIAMAALLPRPLSPDLDLLALAYNNDGSFETIAALIKIGLFRQGYYPVLNPPYPGRNISDSLCKAWNEARHNPPLRFFGALVMTRSLALHAHEAEAIQRFIAEGGRRLSDMNIYQYGLNKPPRAVKHVIAVTDMVWGKSGFQAEIVDSSLKELEEGQVKAVWPLERLERVAVPPHSFLDDETCVIIQGLPLEYAHQGETDINQSDWRFRLQTLEEESREARELAHKLLKTLHTNSATFGKIQQST